MGVVKDAPKGGRPKNGADSAPYSEQAAARRRPAFKFAK
jgi:hypothetical protein